MAPGPWRGCASVCLLSIPQHEPYGWSAELLLGAMVGMARCAVPARVVAGGTNFKATLAFEGVAPLHAARTSQRDVPTTLNTYAWLQLSRPFSAQRLMPKVCLCLRHSTPDSTLVLRTGIE